MRAVLCWFILPEYRIASQVKLEKRQRVYREEDWKVGEDCRDWMREKMGGTRVHQREMTEVLGEKK